MMRGKILLFSTIVLLCFIFQADAQKKGIEKEKVVETSKFKPSFQKGMCFVPIPKKGGSFGSPKCAESLKRLKDCKVEWICLVPYGNQKGVDATDISLPSGKEVESLPDSILIAGIREIHEAGFKIFLRPQVWVGEKEWRGNISFSDEDKWKDWLSSYERFIVHFARIAEKEKIELFSIGDELQEVSFNKETEFRKIINEVRKVYKGPLVYSAYFREYKGIRFWDELDYIGINSYFSLSDVEDVSVGDLKNVWSLIVKEIEGVRNKFKKPVLFTEIGYKSVYGCVLQPWERNLKGKVNIRAQAEAYQALLETFWDKPWFSGVYWWRWYSDPSIGGEKNSDYTPQGKIAENIIKEWFGKDRGR